MDDIKERQLQNMDEDPVSPELIEQTISLMADEDNAAIDRQPPDPTQTNEVAFNEQDDRKAALTADTSRPQIDQSANNSPKAIVMISAPRMKGNVTADGGAASGPVSTDNQMASICRTCPDSQPSKATCTSHTDDEKPTHIDSVTLKCDLNDYLINLTNIRCSLAQSNATPKASQPAGERLAELSHHDIMPSDTNNTRNISYHPDRKLGVSAYTHFDELVRCSEREREWVRCRGLSHRMPRLRLCGGGEDSINNGTSAWGTPPGASGNGTLSAWGVLPNQQQQPQQQSLPPSAWGSINNSNPGNSTSNNNNGSSGAGSTGNVANGNGNTANTGANVGQQRVGGPSAADPNSNKVNTQPASAPNAWNATVNHGRHGAPSGTNATVNVANNNGNHHHGHNNNQLQQQQQQQAANMGAGNNNGAGNGTATKQLEVLNTMRDALFSQDGWGCQHVNQDTNWEVPGSPEPQGAASAAGGGGGGSGTAGGVGAKPDGAGSHGAGPNGSWKPQTMNNGTELWETNLRNGSGGPIHLQQQQQHHQQAQQHLAQAKTAQWVPANNLGGTWMEDDDSTGGPAGVPETAANVWNGSAAAIVAGAVPLGPSGGPGVGQAPGWGALNNGNVVTAPPAAGGAGTVGGGMWPSGGNTPAITTAPTTTGSMNNPQMAAIGVKKDLNEWGGGVGPIGSVGSGAVGVPGGPGIPTQGGWDARSASTTGTLPMAAGAVNGQSAVGFNINTSIGGAPSDGLGNRIGGGDLRGDPRGISGRLNGAAAGSMWGANVPDQRSGTSSAGGGVVLPGGVSGVGGQQWGGNGNGGPNKLPTNWDDGRPSSLDDASGGALWGQGNAGGLSRQNSTGWKDVSDVMMRPGGGGGAGGGPMQRNQQHAPPVQAGGTGPFGPVPSGAASGVRVGGGTGGGLSLGKDGMWGGQVQGIVRNGSWEDQTPGGGWGDEKGGGAPWNMDLASNGAGGMAGGWNKTPTTPKSAGIGWPDPSELNATGAGMDWGLGGKPSTGGSNKPPTLNNPLEFIRASKEYRLLCDMGHKKEDVEFVLRTTNLNIDEAMELLRHGAAVAGLTTGWRRTLSEDHAGGLGMGFDGAYSGRIPPLNHATSGLSYSQNNQNLLNNIPGGGPVSGLGLDGTGPANLVALNNLKYLSQGAGGGAGAAHPSFNHNSLLPPGGRGPNQQPQAHQQQQQQQQQQLAAAAAAQPTNQQLRVLVQQIQLAVQNGFLNHQILNQPLAPQTFILLNQLLTHIKQMQLTQSNLARSGTTGAVSAVQLSLAINKHKTQIAQLQQQIATQQSIYLKQQQQQQGHQASMGPPPPLMQSNPNAGLGMDFMRQQQQDLMALQGTFGEMALGKDSIITSTGSVFPPPVVPLQQQQQQQQQQQHAAVSAAPGNVIVSGSTSQQSRLNQWKLPSLEKDPTASKDDLTDFSRAPGPSTAKSALTTTTTNTNISSLGLVQDGTWTTGRTNLADGWPEQTGDTDSKDWNTTTNTSPQDSSAFTDLVPEFEPGKPWKGTQLKIEDDPSITPGSVARSPLSIATAKDSELFGGVGGTSVTEKTSPIAADGGGLNLTSSAWSFNTASLTSVAGGNGGTGGNKPMAGKSVWSDSSSAGGGNNVAVSSSAAVDVWCTSIVKPSATRGPPPGLGGATGNKNGGGVSLAGTQQRTGAGWATGTSWLLLKNLTSQIDASTLRTLCMQHGPILNFHSYPSHGLALCRYATREEAAKAQQALNNCTLGSSTISAECPGSESEVQTYLQQLGGAATTSVAVSSSASSLTSPSWRQERTPSSSGGDTWGSGWAIGGSGSSGTGTAANLWAPLDAGTDTGTPTSLNSFLPDSLLGPELN